MKTSKQGGRAVDLLKTWDESYLISGRISPFANMKFWTSVRPALSQRSPNVFTRQNTEENLVTLSSVRPNLTAEPPLNRLRPWGKKRIGGGLTDFKYSTLSQLPLGQEEIWNPWATSLKHSSGCSFLDAPTHPTNLRVHTGVTVLQRGVTAPLSLFLVQNMSVLKFCSLISNTKQKGCY